MECFLLPLDTLAVRKGSAVKHGNGTILLVSIVGACLLAVWGPTLREEALVARASYSANLSEAKLRARNQSAFSKILGETRATAADLLFVKTLNYAHAGVAYASTKGFDASGELEGCGPGIPTLIRSASEDFRGFLGDLERQVKPYQDSSKTHVHTEETELMPWYRIITLSNPNFVRAYRIGSSILSRDGKWEEAQQFLEEGLKQNAENPERFLLYHSLAYLYLTLARANVSDHPDLATEYQGRALDAALQAYELGLECRPPEGKSDAPYKGVLWTETVEDDFRMVTILIPQILDFQGRRDEAFARATELQKLYPKFQPLQALIQRLLRSSDQMGPQPTEGS
jgi:tetratricopeptide (TPR) repeat protein